MSAWPQGSSSARQDVAPVDAPVMGWRKPRPLPQPLSQTASQAPPWRSAPASQAEANEPPPWRRRKELRNEATVQHGGSAASDKQHSAIVDQDQAHYNNTTSGIELEVRRSSPKDDGQSRVFVIGEKVRYWSGTHRKWVEAHVQGVNHTESGELESYDLTAKAKAEIARVKDATTAEDAPPPAVSSRLSPTGAGNESLEPASRKTASEPLQAEIELFGDGEKVQYFSETKERWIDAVVEAQHTKDGVISYDLNCKKGVLAERLRSAGVQYRVGENVEYWSASARRWMPAKVEALHAEAKSCDLTVKPGAPLNRVRKVPNSSTSLSKVTCPISVAQGVGVPPPPLACSFKAGDQVQYFSETRQRWMETTVLRMFELDGNICYDLECKKGVSADKVRSSLRVSQEHYKVGEVVEYWSVSAGRWLPAKVVGVRPDLGQCDLDIKLAAPIGRIKRASAAQEESSEQDLGKRIDEEMVPAAPVARAVQIEVVPAEVVPAEVVPAQVVPAEVVPAEAHAEVLHSKVVHAAPVVEEESPEQEVEKKVEDDMPPGSSAVEETSPAESRTQMRDEKEDSTEQEPQKKAEELPLAPAADEAAELPRLSPPEKPRLKEKGHRRRRKRNDTDADAQGQAEDNGTCKEPRSEFQANGDGAGPGRRRRRRRESEAAPPGAIHDETRPDVRDEHAGTGKQRRSRLAEAHVPDAGAEDAARSEIRTNRDRGLRRRVPPGATAKALPSRLTQRDVRDRERNERDRPDRGSGDREGHRGACDLIGAAQDAMASVEWQRLVMEQEEAMARQQGSGQSPRRASPRRRSLSPLPRRKNDFRERPERDGRDGRERDAREPRRSPVRSGDRSREGRHDLRLKSRSRSRRRRPPNVGDQDMAGRKPRW
mmetsp:Transcript_15364/g.34912  ORF Transcript_15364/g.34912 Transcript_15364/m.34912 type:complete len:884 (+) Transcript_15364:51-2702(+)